MAKRGGYVKEVGRRWRGATGMVVGEGEEREGNGRGVTIIIAEDKNEDGLQPE